MNDRVVLLAAIFSLTPPLSQTRPQWRRGAAEFVTETIGGHRVLVVTRYDRRVEKHLILRLDQEDVCQALGRDPSRRYESEGGPSAADIAELLRASALARDLELLSGRWRSSG